MRAAFAAAVVLAQAAPVTDRATLAQRVHDQIIHEREVVIEYRAANFGPDKPAAKTAGIYASLVE